MTMIVGEQLKISYESQTPAYLNDRLVSNESPFNIDFVFGSDQLLKVGEQTISLSELMVLKHYGGITAEPIGAISSIALFTVKGLQLTRIEMFGRADPKLLILSQKTGECVYTSEVCSKTRDPIWESFELSVDSLCNGDISSEIKFQVWDHNEGSPDVLMGELTTNLSIVCSDSLLGQSTYEMVNPERPGTRRGDLYVHVEMKQAASFMQWLNKGNAIRCGVSIDFTASNGNPAFPRSLHYERATNQYVACMSKFTKRLLPFSGGDPRIHATGFGAKVEGAVNHCFSLSSIADCDSLVDGLGSLLQHYRDRCTSVELHGPTKVAEVLKKIGETFHQLPFYVHLICTDGDVTDMVPTLTQLTALQEFPMFIIFVGIYSDPKVIASFQESNHLSIDQSDAKEPPNPALEDTGDAALGDVTETTEEHSFPKLEVIAAHCVNVAFVNTAHLDAALSRIPQQILSFYNK